jgi:O-antigen ligase
MAVIALIIAAHNFQFLSRAFSPPHIRYLLAYLAFAGASVLWAFSPELSFIRYVQQLMVIASIIIPGFFAARSVDLMRGLFLSFGFAVILNIFFVIQGYQTVADKLEIGYSGYFPGKNYLGECVGVAILLSLHELFYSGLRRIVGMATLTISIVLMFYSNSKTSLGLALIAPFAAILMLMAWRAKRISPAVTFLSAVLGYMLFAKLTGFSMNRLAYMLYGDSTFTGRQVIWDYVALEIAHKPVFGWGYQSFWLVGPQGPSVVNAPGWVKTMPNAHNGYYDTVLEMGYIGLALLMTFIAATLHAVRRVAQRNFARAWVILSILLFIMMHNGLESTWMRGFEFLWLVFLILAADIARYWQPYQYNFPRPQQIPPTRDSTMGPRRRTARVSGI